MTMTKIPTHCLNAEGMSTAWDVLGLHGVRFVLAMDTCFFPVVKSLTWILSSFIRDQAQAEELISEAALTGQTL